MIFPPASALFYLKSFTVVFSKKTIPADRIPVKSYNNYDRFYKKNSPDKYRIDHFLRQKKNIYNYFFIIFLPYSALFQRKKEIYFSKIPAESNALLFLLENIIKPQLCRILKGEVPASNRKVSICNKRKTNYETLSFSMYLYLPPPPPFFVTAATY